MKTKYLIIGSAATDDPRTHGGVTLLVRQLLDYFDEKNKEYIFIQAMQFKGGNKISMFFNYIYVLFNVLIHIRKVDIVMVNVSSNGAYYLSPLVLFISKIFKKKFIFRRFAGNCIELYNAAPLWKRKLMDYLIKQVDIMFFEPQYLVKYFSKKRSNTFWFPNVRKKSNIVREKGRPYANRFIYIGQIRRSKGIDELLATSEKLSSNYHIDLYGTLFDTKYNETYLEKFQNVTYKGRVHHKKIYETLAQYDVLVLPSYMEGYPGVLIEAYAVGLPVIVSDLPSTREIVDHEKTGLLIEVKNVDSLLTSMKWFDTRNYNKMSYNASKKFNIFEYEQVYRNVIEICEEK